MRAPTSSPREATRPGTLSMASPLFGSSLAVVPRASLLWKPRPALKKNSVFAHGPKISESLGDSMLSLARPELAGCERLSTPKRALSARRPTTLRSHGVSSTAVWP